MKSDRELQIASEQKTCKHYRGTQYETCLVGVNYRLLVGGDDLGWGTRLPCHFFFHPKNGEKVSCDKRELHTEAEAVARVDAGQAAIERHMKALSVAHQDAKAKGLKKGHGGQSECVCPICAGVLRYTVASYNGHMHATCVTDGCVAWME